MISVHTCNENYFIADYPIIYLNGRSVQEAVNNYMEKLKRSTNWKDLKIFPKVATMATIDELPTCYPELFI